MGTTVVLVTGIAIAALAWLAWMQRRGARWPSDAECIAILRQAGVDLTKPRKLDFHLHFATRVIALEAERTAREAGFATRVGGGPGLPDAILCASRTLVPSVGELRAVRKQLEAVARRHGGRYEGCLPRGGDTA